MNFDSSRRSSFKKMILGGAAVGSLVSFDWKDGKAPLQLKGNINHGVCAWTMPSLNLDELCVAIKKIGFNAIDLVGPKGWDTLKAHEVECSMCNGAELGIPKGWNDPQYHEQLIKNYTELIPEVAKYGYKNLICFSGNRNGMDDETGMKNCAEGLKKIIGVAEKHGVIIQMELLNSKVNHKDYMCDLSPWGVELCKMIDSENFKLLYDIYHMQIDEGDIIRSIQTNHQYFGHYHTAGNPGRNELDENQEINYPAVMRAIVATGYQGYVSHEFIPKSEDKIAALAQAVQVCDV
ncbi:hydroxypyruvate isomerase family protein [Algoriphagus boritolerans]|uniref:Hydroxypyruvate isomerase n=2 Tax=Algoriphagus TaxID=246875 RepID=A0A1H5YJV7_9BACT|nr:TIM barrel protein [Algoriphagus boritolerans]SEG23972.1 hydroxypyruvate isomerase [Algoriphagus boritolerans DSM 17298 = JCM 18970]